MAACGMRGVGCAGGVANPKSKRDSVVGSAGRWKVGSCAAPRPPPACRPKTSIIVIEYLLDKFSGYSESIRTRYSLGYTVYSRACAECARAARDEVESGERRAVSAKYVFTSSAVPHMHMDLRG